MNSKKLILLEHNDLLVKRLEPTDKKAIAQRMAGYLGADPTNFPMELVFDPTTNDCAYSKAQTEKKLSAILTEKKLELPVVVEAYLKATEFGCAAKNLFEYLTLLGDTVKLGVLTNAFWFSTPAIKESLPQDMFDFFFQSGDLHCRKPWPQMYELVESITGIRGENILLLDPNYRNVLGARERGWHAELATYETPVDTLDDVITTFLEVSDAPAAGEAPADTPALKHTAATPPTPAKPAPEKDKATPSQAKGEEGKEQEKPGADKTDKSAVPF